MKSEWFKSVLRSIWAFCSFLFVPQWGNDVMKIYSRVRI